LSFLVDGGLLISADDKKEDQSIQVVLWQQAGDLMLTKLRGGSLVSIKGSLQKAAMAAYQEEQLLEISGGELTLLTN